jgi:D-glycero-alpha-D-manno-heptose-7-phosphate kinase
VVAHAPCRVDLAGGTLDIWPLYLFHTGAVTVNFAVNVLARCRVSPLPGRRIHLKSIDARREEQFRNFDELCRARKFEHPLAAQLVRFFAPDGGLLVETNSESPAGAGISGSSALMIASAAALSRYTGKRLDREGLRQLAQNVEAQLIGVPTGCQDYYPAIYGGVSAIALEPDGVHRHAIAVSAEEIERRFVLAYTGAPRASGINNWQVFKAHINGDKKIHANFESIARIARDMHRALENRDWNEVARLLRAEWKLRKTNAPGISTPLIDRLVAAAMKGGALAAKVCGAGGGGCVVFLVSPERKEEVARTVRASGGQVLPCRVAQEGLTVNSARRAN